ncbi:hypothetical protein GF358_01010 [Candidatus Woesearchaeota archaeon]|nr:hypothetical protein [Candidatus Woesearchaeota archaeon]
MLKKEESKIKPDLKIADEYLDLRTLDTNIIVKKLEENMKLRLMKIDKHAEKQLQ